MSPIITLAHSILILHGLLNIAQGLYSLISPLEYAALAGELFANTPEVALKSIGLGAIGVGLYESIFAYQGNRALILATIPMRILFAFVVYDWGSVGAVVYELGVVGICGLALL